MRGADWVAPERYELQPDGRRFEEWEQPYAAKLGLACAIDYALGWGIDAICARVAELAGGLRARLSEIEGVTLRDAGARRCGIVTFDAAGVSADEVKRALAREGVNVSVAATTSAVIDALERNLPDLVRASVHYYNVEDELDRLAAGVARIAGRQDG